MVGKGTRRLSSTSTLTAWIKQTAIAELVLVESAAETRGTLLARLGLFMRWDPGCIPTVFVNHERQTSPARTGGRDWSHPAFLTPKSASLEAITMTERLNQAR